MPVMEGQVSNLLTQTIQIGTYERPGEEDTLDGSKRNQPLGKGAASVRDPLQSPVGLLGDAGDWNRVDQDEREF